MNNSILKGFSPLLQLLFFFMLLLTCVTLGGFVSAGIGVFGFGIPLNELQNVVSDPTEQYALALMWMNNVSQIFTFLLPAVGFVLLFGKNAVNGFMLRPVSLLVLIAAMIFILVSGGVIDLTSQLNKWLIPAGSSIEQWAKPMEEAAEVLTKTIMSKNDPLSLLMIFLSIAIIPAICEEVVFRGVLQPLIAKSTRNIHVAIWLTAIVFSLIHMQFYGFLPRVLIGAFLGYLVIWTGSLWPAILAHFANNATAFVLYKSYGSMEAPEGSIQNEWYTYALSIFLFGALVFWFRQKSKWPWIAFEYLGITKKLSTTNEPTV